MEVVVRDSNGTALTDGDTVLVIKDLQVNDTSITRKRGTVIKNIKRGDSDEAVGDHSDQVKGLRLRAQFLKKV